MKRRENNALSQFGFQQSSNVLLTHCVKQAFTNDTLRSFTSKAASSLVAILLSMFGVPLGFAADPESQCEKQVAGSMVGSHQQLRNLLSAGFRQVDHSNYFRRGGFLIKLEPDGGFRLFSNVAKEFSSPGVSFVGAKMKRHVRGREGSQYWYDTLSLYFKEGDHYPLRTYGIGRGFDHATKAEIPEVKENNLKQHLLDVGADQDPRFPSILRLNLASSKSHLQKEFLAIFAGNHLVQMVSELSSELIDRLSPETEIRGFRLFSDQDQEGLSAISFRQNSFEFELSDGFEGGAFVHGSQKLASDLADVDDKDIHLKLPPENSQPSDEKIGGFNVSAWLRSRSSTIWGEPAVNDLDTLVEKLRPGKASNAGFLGEAEDFANLLKSDDDHVTRDLGLDHKKIAYPLLKIMAAKLAGFPDEFTYMGYHYRSIEVGWMGYQSSPFNDGTSTSYDIVLTNLDSGKTLNFSALVPQMIYRYGFYEGKGSSYRLDPDEILALLPFLIH